MNRTTIVLQKNVDVVFYLGLAIELKTPQMKERFVCQCSNCLGKDLESFSIQLQYLTFVVVVYFYVVFCKLYATFFLYLLDVDVEYSMYVETIFDCDCDFN